MKEIKLEGQVVVFEHKTLMHSHLHSLPSWTQRLRDEIEGMGYNVNRMNISVVSETWRLCQVSITISVHRPPHVGWLEQEIG